MEGYGSQKNYANKLALNNWILSIDADEVLSNELIDEIKALNLNDENLCFNIPLKQLMWQTYKTWAMEKRTSCTAV
ncbi:MAG: hypothetical protein R2777_03650 [Chitinophagales bacterium]